MTSLLLVGGRRRRLWWRPWRDEPAERDRDRRLDGPRTTSWSSDRPAAGRRGRRAARGRERCGSSRGAPRGLRKRRGLPSNGDHLL